MNHKGTQRLLIVGAFRPELDILFAEAENLNQRLQPYNLAVEIFEVGIGNLQAALTLQRRLLDKNLPAVSEIIFFGSAGSYFGNSEDTGCFAICNHFTKYDLAFLRRQAHLPQVLLNSFSIQTSTGPFAEKIKKQGNFISGSCNCPDSLTLEVLSTDSNLWPEPCFENMECFGLATAAKDSPLFTNNPDTIPFTAFLAITNAVGPEGSEQWQRNFRRMGQDLQKMVLSLSS